MSRKTTEHDAFTDEVQAGPTTARTESTPFILEDALEMAGEVARAIGRKWNGIDPDDIAQTLALHVLSNQSIFEKAAYGGGALRQILRGVANTQAGAMREVETLAALDLDEVITPSNVRDLLTSYYTYLPLAPEPFVRTPEGVQVSAATLEACIDRLSKPALDLLLCRYLHGAAQTATESKRANRAVDRICRWLNQAALVSRNAVSSHEGPGARRAISNAEGQWLAGTDTDKAYSAGGKPQASTRYQDRDPFGHEPVMPIPPRAENPENVCPCKCARANGRCQLGVALTTSRLMVLRADRERAHRADLEAAVGA